MSKKARMTVTVDPQVREQTHATAKRARVSVSWVMETALIDYLTKGPRRKSSSRVRVPEGSDRADSA